jgi:hypothetical protein
MVRIRRERPRRPSAIVRVSTEVVEGTVDSAALLEWVQEAVDCYHRARAGHVGILAQARVKKPEVSLYEEGQEEDRGG